MIYAICIRYRAETTEYTTAKSPREAMVKYCKHFNVTLVREEADSTAIEWFGRIRTPENEFYDIHAYQPKQFG
jgi:hypothetical protein